MTDHINKNGFHSYRASENKTCARIEGGIIKKQLVEWMTVNKINIEQLANQMKMKNLEQADLWRFLCGEGRLRRDLKNRIVTHCGFPA